MAYYGKKKQSYFLPEDGFVTFFLDADTREKLEKYMQFQPPNTSLPVTVRELVHLGLSAVPEESALHATRMRVRKDAQHHVYKRLGQMFKELDFELRETALANADDFDMEIP